MSSNSLIINSPFNEPHQYWDLNSDGNLEIVSGRRKSQYMLTKKGGTADAGDQGKLFGLHDFQFVNDLRDIMRPWRAGGYNGTTQTTRALLEHWNSNTRHDFRLFFCQLEAAEAIIFLTETKQGQELAKKIQGDGSPFTRWCAKMATGTGKTVVMAMLIAWHTLNKVANSESGLYCNNLLIVAPGLTVKDRLQVRNLHHSSNYYE